MKFDWNHRLQCCFLFPKKDFGSWKFENMRGGSETSQVVEIFWGHSLHCHYRQSQNKFGEQSAVDAGKTEIYLDIFRSSATSPSQTFLRAYSSNASRYRKIMDKKPLGRTFCFVHGDGWLERKEFNHFNVSFDKNSQTLVVKKYVGNKSSDRKQG